MYFHIELIVEHFLIFGFHWSYLLLDLLFPRKMLQSHHRVWTDQRLGNEVYFHWKAYLKRNILIILTTHEFAKIIRIFDWKHLSWYIFLWSLNIWRSSKLCEESHLLSDLLLFLFSLWFFGLGTKIDSFKLGLIINSVRKKIIKNIWWMNY